MDQVLDALKRELMKWIAWGFVMLSLERIMKTLGMILGILCASPGWAADYNFYFNNAEQGANSTASPSIVVKPGESYSAKDADTEPEAVAPQPQPTETPAATETVAQLGGCSNLFCQIGMAMPHGISLERGLAGVKLGL